MQERVKKPKRPGPASTMVTLAINAELVTAAAAEHVDLAALLEQALARRLMGGDQTRLGDEDRVAMAAMERHIAEHGNWWDGMEKL